MAQFLRICKPEICCVARCYCSRRYQQNHYEILNVSPDATQKEIRQAFIRLSKQLHPDTSGKQCHADFVKLNEAYKILGKERTRCQYDFDMKYNRYYQSYMNNSQNNSQQYGSQWEYEVRTVGGPWPPPRQKPNEGYGLLIALGCCGLGLILHLFMFYSIKARRMKAILQNAELESKYQRIRDSASNKINNQISIENLNSLEDLNEYLSENISER